MSLPSEDWLPLLRRLTEVSESWAVWKNADRALVGQGDVDSIAPAGEHELLAREFSDWASTEGYGWVVRCSHPGGILILVAVDESRWAQLDLVFETPFRGSSLFSVDQLRPLMIMDQRGFRRIRDGAEGFFLFLYKGMRRGGRPDWASLDKYHVIEKMITDWPSAEAAASLLGGAGDLLLRAARSAASGRWARGLVIEAEALTVMKSIASPSAVAKRAVIRGWYLPRCVVVRAVRNGRQPEPFDRWLREANRQHSVKALKSGAARQSHEYGRIEKNSER